MAGLARRLYFLATTFSGSTKAAALSHAAYRRSAIRQLHMRYIVKLGAAICLFSTIGCLRGTSGPPADTLEKNPLDHASVAEVMTVEMGGSRIEIKEAFDERSSARKTIDALTANRRCESKSDCRWLPLGSLPCGGPRTYTVYSHGLIRTWRLKRLSEKHMAADAKLNRLLGRVSICPYIAPPEIDCVDDVCRIMSRHPFDQG